MAIKKQKIIIMSLLIAACFILTFMLCSCGKSTEKLDGCISELRDEVYVGSCEGFKVSAVSGVHEMPFNPDGKAEKKQEFTVITVEPEEFIPNRIYGYITVINGNEYTGVMSMHPFGESYSVEIEARTHEKTLTLTLKNGAETNTVVLESVVGEDDISADAALDTAIKTLESDLKPIKKSGGYDCEIYVRLIANPINAEGGYYWYVAFIGENTYAALIDRKSGEVIGIKN